MKKYFLLILLSLSIFLIYSLNIYSGWLEKGMNIVNSFHKSSNKLSTNDIIAGLKEALKVGSENVVKRLGKINGFYNDSNVHIPLPNSLKKIKKTLSKIGMDRELNNLELKLNRAAELATPKAKKIFLKAISQMTIEDAKKIYKGPRDAATQYFKRKMTEPLKNAMKPIIENSLNEVKAVKVYNSIIEKYNSLPFVKHINGDISNYVLKKALNGIFFYLAKEEAAIRENPAKRTTEILKKVFGRN